MQMEIVREEYSLLAKRLKEKRKFIQVIVGPRQVGKTTLVKQLIRNENHLFIYESADDVNSHHAVWISQLWERARFSLKTSKKRHGVLVIDEIQKVKNWSSVVKKEWDSDSLNNINIKVILLGSSTLLIQKGLNESLAGRFEIIQLGHWTYPEVKKAFGVSPSEYVWFGGYPGPYSLIQDENRWKDYIKNSLIETTVAKDILHMNRIDKPALLKNLFDLGCSYSGQVLSFTKMLGQLQDAGNTVTLAHYLYLLDQAWLLSGLQKYSSQEFRRKASSPKFQVYNTALISALRSETFNQIINIPDEWGQIVESAIGAHLVNFSKKRGFNLYYWRHVNFEVDFVLQYGNRIIALEIKSGQKIIKKGIEQFQKEFQPTKVLLVGTGGIPWDEFLQTDPMELF
jgi:predicted AAA+ superfamily ATPase